MLLTMLAACVLATGPQTFDLTPTDDVWVYPHASDPQKDPFLRAWGSAGKAVAATPAEGSDFSYSYLKWDTAAISKAPGKVTEAKLIVTLIADPTYGEDEAKASPLEVRPLKGDFSEKTWDYG